MKKGCKNRKEGMNIDSMFLIFSNSKGLYPKKEGTFSFICIIFPDSFNKLAVIATHSCYNILIGEITSVLFDCLSRRKMSITFY